MVLSGAAERKPAVAGSFYPANPSQLQSQIKLLLDRAEQVELGQVRALIVPHAGYRYSGPVAASALRQVQPGNGRRRTIYLLGPAHYARVRGVALAPVRRFSTPLGCVDQNLDVVEDLLTSGPIYELQGAAHEPEHCLEVILPFLQAILPRFELVALLCGEPPVEQIAEDLSDRLSADDLLIISSDLSHFHAYRDAVRLDRELLRSICAGDRNSVAQGEACGLIPILILMHVAERKAWQPTLLDYRNSGDTGGDRRRVVGYAAVAYSTM